MFIHWHSTAKTRVRDRDCSWFWKLKLRFLGASSTEMRRCMNVEIYHLNNTELLKERARHTEHMQSCIYSWHIMLWGDDMPSFPSLLLIFSLYLGSLTLEIIYFSSANHDSPFFSLMVSFCSKLLMCFSHFTSASLANAHEQWGVQIPAAFTGTGHTPVQLEPAGLGFSECSCGGAGYRPIETCLVAQPCLPQGGVKNRNCLWKFTDSEDRMTSC